MQKTVAIQTQLSVIMLREGKHFVAYCPALDLSTSGKTFKKAQHRVSEVINIFFKEIYRRGTLNEVLQELGWQHTQRTWQPPTVVSQQYLPVTVSHNSAMSVPHYA